MKREILIPIVISCVVALLPMLTWSQNNNTSTLKIAVPVREFKEFVSVTRNYNTGKNNYSGFAIEVFREVMNTTPFEFVAFQKPDGSMNGTFDNMLQAVASKDYDGAVGDISILFVRTQWVDFTMPFMESSITMLVRIKQQETSNVAGYSLIGIIKAFIIITFGLAFFVAIIYFLGMTKWAKLVGGSNIRPRDKTLGSLTHTRILITTFFLILFIPMACYIISQASANTFRKSGSINTLNQLIKNGANVGYKEGSFIYNLLLQNGFSESKLISLKSERDMADKLSKGTSQGGVDSIIADSITLKLLQAQHCDAFTIVPTTTNLLASGFGFAFGKDSTITANVSSGILQMIDDGRLKEIKERTIGNLETCQDDPNYNLDVGSSFLSSEYKWILVVGGLLVVFFLLLSFASLY